MQEIERTLQSNVEQVIERFSITQEKNWVCVSL